MRLHELIWPNRKRYSIYLYWNILTFYLSVLFVILYEISMRKMEDSVILYQSGITEVHYPIKYTFFTLKQQLVWDKGVIPASIKKFPTFYLIKDIYNKVYKSRHVYINNYPLLELSKICLFDVILLTDITILDKRHWIPAVTVESTHLSLHKDITNYINLFKVNFGEYNIIINKVCLGLLTI